MRQDSVLRCTGHCCRKFYIKPEVTDNLLIGRDGEDGRYVDGAQIRDMLIATDTENLWTCRHHLPSGDCGIYEERPAMCRNYDPAHCNFEGCTAKPAEVCSGE